MALSAGTTISTGGVVLGTATLAYGNSYVVSGAVTATAVQSGSLQCQLNRQNAGGWDDMAEVDVSQRTTVPLEHAYPRDNSHLASETFTVTIGCIASTAYTVDTGHLYITQVASITQPGGHAIYAPPASLRSEGLK